MAKQKTGFSDEQLRDFKQAFSLFDKDGDGTVTSEELGVVLRSIGLNPSKRELDKIIKEADADGNDTIELNEFLVAMTKKNLPASVSDCGDDVTMTEAEIKKTFRVFDKNNKGYICAAEIRQVGALYGEFVTEEAANQMIAEADSDGDGRVTFQDFLKMMTS